MKKTSLVVFSILSFMHLLAELFNSEITYITKPLLMPTLALHLFSIGGRKNKALLLFIALAFSTIGDVSLMFSNKDELFFLAGLSAFLLAHIMYIWYFLQIKTSEKINIKSLVLLLLYYILFISILWKGLTGPLVVAVPVYAFILLLMAYTAIETTELQDKKTRLAIVLGALLFILSDTLIGLNAFTDLKLNTSIGRLGIMSTYILAQYLIITNTFIIGQKKV